LSRGEDGRWRAWIERNGTRRKDAEETNKGRMMTETSATLVQGTLDMLILKTLALEALHGWGISQRIEQLSRGVFEVNPGSLFPAFRRLERAGLMEFEWRTSENNRRAKYYSLTKAGRQKLKSETKEWERQVAAIARILQTAS
jgi:PadR family transcriptional regulator, regulatory protein PadR